jgi:hypothetical protein
MATTTLSFSKPAQISPAVEAPMSGALPVMDRIPSTRGRGGNRTEAKTRTADSGWRPMDATAWRAASTPASKGSSFLLTPHPASMRLVSFSGMSASVRAPGTVYTHGKSCIQQQCPEKTTGRPEVLLFSSGVNFTACKDECRYYNPEESIFSV